MAVRALWKGTIHFGLVSIPIELYSAVQPHVLGFKLLHNVCHTPITNKRWCTHCNREIAWEETVKGLKLPNGDYFVLTLDALKKLKPEKTDSVDIIEFVDTPIIPPLYYEQHYYALAQNVHDKAYALFVAALERFNKTAIGQFVLRDKEYVCAVQPFEKALLLSTLNYAYEIKPLPREKEKAAPKITQEELKLAELLMSKLYKKEFDVSEFKDSFATKLAQAIKRKEKGEVVTIEKPQPTAAPTVSLMDALRASLTTAEEKPARRTR